MLELLALDLALVALAPALLLVAVAVRRRVLVRDGGFEMAVRTGTRGAALGWTFGVARYGRDELEWFRTFSLTRRPRRVFRRDQLRFVGRRPLRPDERLAIPVGHVVLQLRDTGEPVEVSMSEAALTGLKAWLEAAPPGRGLVA